MLDGLDLHGPRRKTRAMKARRPWWQVAGLAAGVVLAAVLVLWSVRRYSHSLWWQSERERIETLANDGHYGEAMAVLHDDREQMGPGAEADAGAAYAQDLEARWEKYATDQTDPMFARFDRDLTEHQFKEAQATLRQIPESLLCPPVKAEVEKRGEQLEQTLMDAADLSATSAAAETDKRYQQQTDEVRREAMAMAAERFWRGFACIPAGEPSVEDGTATFAGVGHGQCDLKAAGPLTQMRTRAFALRLHPNGTWNGEERWEMDLGGAKLAMTSAGIMLAEAGKPSRLLEAVTGRGEVVLRLRRNGGTWLCKVDPPKGKADPAKADDWLTLEGGEVIAISWSLSDGNSLAASFTGRTR
jgi:hypothetical protein